MSKKIIVIGGGPGGYAAAIRAAQLGAEVALVEASHIGGTCLNEGCIPTKALLHTGEFYRLASRNSVAGVNIIGVELDWQRTLEHKNTIVSHLSKGVSALLKHNGVTVFHDQAVPLSGHKVKIGNDINDADAVILAPGSISTRLSFPGSVLPGVIDGAEALSLDKVPESIVIVGGGVIGVELASLYRSFGAKVTIIEALHEILPSFDSEIAEIMRSVLTLEGTDVFVNFALTSVTQSDGGMLSVQFQKEGTEQAVVAEKVLIAVGRTPNTSCLEGTGVAMTNGAVVVNDYFETSIPNLYAVGDCNGKIMLAHAAMAQGVAAAERIMGATPHYNAKVIPSCVYTSPEIACCGMTEQQVIESGVEHDIGRFSLAGNGKSMIDGDGGLIKIIADRRYGELLGVHMVGPRVTEMIAEAALCMSMEGTVEDIANTVHAHPTVSEAVREAALSVFGNPIHGV